MQSFGRDSRKADGVTTPTYRGRFAPSPTGPLHFGSLVAAVGSFVQARHLDGEWLLRIDDLDTLRNVAGAADQILHTLERMELYWDGAIVYQSNRKERYADALEKLAARDHSFPCACTRKEVGDRPYPGTCRNGVPSGRKARATRAITDVGSVRLNDVVRGWYRQNLATEVGDFIIRRADGLTAYHLATVVDDADQGITQIVRGSDLLPSTPRQIHLQRLLGLPTPVYAHLPVAVNASGQKLSKQTHAPALNEGELIEQGLRALRFLGQSPPSELVETTLTDLWVWAVAHWDIMQVPCVAAQPATD